MASYDWQDVANAKPAEVRAALLLPAGVDLGQEGIELSLSLTDRKEQVLLQEAAGLQLLDEGPSVVEPLPAADKGSRWLVHALDDDGVAAFRHLQAVLRDAKADGRNVTFGFGISGGFERPESMGAFPLSLWLKLDKADGWFALLEEAEVEFGRDYGTH